MDVSGDASFPDGYWEAFREVVKSVDPNVLTISETWQKDTALLRAVRGDRFDTSMNYRLRDAIIGLLSPNPFDPKGFGDSGRQLAPSEFASRLESIREDFPDAAFYSAMNLIDSHDTERALWTLTPGADTRAAKEQNAANLAEGKQRLRLASLLQFTLPGAPTVYYGDEVGVTGDDDPDDRRTYPWSDLGGSPDATLLGHYTGLAALRRAHPSLTDGSFSVASVDDAAGTVVLERRSATERALVALNVSGVAAHPAGRPARSRRRVGTRLASPGGTLTLGPLSGALLVEQGDFDPPAAPERACGHRRQRPGLAVLERRRRRGRLRRLPQPALGRRLREGERSAARRHELHRHRARERPHLLLRRPRARRGRQPSAASNEVSALPHLTIGWANLQWPPTLTHTISVTDRTDDVYGQVWIDGATGAPGPTDGPAAPSSASARTARSRTDAWTWVEAAFNTQAGNNDEFVASLLPEAVGTYDYAYRYSTTGGRDWVYADLDGIQNGYSPANAGSLTVSPSGDATAPATPAGLRVVTASPAGIELAWDAVTGDPSLYGYEVRRADSAAGPYATIARVTGTGYTDTNVTESQTYHYVVRSLDGSFNRSPDSAPVAATAELRTVSIVFTVTVPATTDATGRSVYIAGFLNRLDGGLPEWNPGGVVLTRARRHPLAGDADRQGVHPDRVQVRARRLGVRREGRRVRRDRQPPAHGGVRRRRRAERERRRPQLAQRRALRELKTVKATPAGAPDATGRRTAYPPERRARERLAARRRCRRAGSWSGSSGRTSTATSISASSGSASRTGRGRSGWTRSRSRGSSATPTTPRSCTRAARTANARSS